MEAPYPKLKERREDYCARGKEEEERFKNTLISSLPKLEEQ